LIIYLKTLIRGMRVLIVAPVELEKPGGMSTHITELAKEILRRGEEVDVVSITGAIPGVPTYSTNFKGCGQGKIVQASLRQALLAKKIAEIKKPDVIHVRGIYNAYLLGRILRKSPILYEVPCLAIYENRTGELKRKQLYLAEKKAIENADCTRTQTRYGEKILEGISGRENFVLPPGVALERFSREKTGGNSILFIGSLHWWQNVENMIRAAKEVARADETIRFKIAGDGPQRIALERLAMRLELKNTEFLGIVPHEKIPALISESMGFMIAKSDHRQANMSVPIKLLEAMAAGAAVISNRIAGVQEIAGKSAIYADTENSMELGESILRLAQDNRLRYDLCKKARKQAERYSWEKTGKKLCEHYMALLK